MEKQVTGFSRQQLETFLEVLNSRKNENNNGRNSEQKKEKHTRRQSRKEESKNQDGFSKSDDQENNTYKSSEDPSHQYRNEEADSMKFSWYDIIRDDIDEAVESSDSYEEFLEYLKSLHYETRDRKYLSLNSSGDTIRKSLGKELIKHFDNQTKKCSKKWEFG